MHPEVQRFGKGIGPIGLCQKGRVFRIVIYPFFFCIKAAVKFKSEVGNGKFSFFYVGHYKVFVDNACALFQAAQVNESNAL